MVKDTLNKPIPFVNIFTPSGEGTLTNENGEFNLKVKMLPAQITVSHVSYQAFIFKVSDEKILNLTLKEGFKTLPEVIVGNYALELIKKTIEKVSSDSSFNHFGKGFYRKIAKEEDKYTVLHEIFFNANFNGKYGIRSWQPTASRYTEHDGHFEIKTLSRIILENTSPSPRIHFYIKGKGFIPVDELSNYYSFEIEHFLNENTPNEVAVILCTPKVQIKNTFTGRFYIKTNTNSVLRVVGDETNVINASTNNFWFKLKKSELHIDKQFRENNETVVLAGMEATLYTTVTYGSSVNKEGAESVKLLIYDYDSPSNISTFLQPIYKTKEDQLFSTTQESPEFWENNPIIKRTPLEDEVIKAFEKKKKKGGNMVFPTQK